jgi:hypothetical protein
MADFEFHDYSIQVKQAMNSKINAVLAEVSGELVSATQRNSRVRTGKTKGSFRYEISKSGGTTTAQIGSDYINAIWEEFGTGEFATNGNGRKGGWYYVDAQGKGHFTRGKAPTRAFWNAYNSLKNAIINRIQSALRGM